MTFTSSSAFAVTTASAAAAVEAEDFCLEGPGSDDSPSKLRLRKPSTASKADLGVSLIYISMPLEVTRKGEAADMGQFGKVSEGRKKNGDERIKESKTGR